MAKNNLWQLPMQVRDGTTGQNHPNFWLRKSKTEEKTAILSLKLNLREEQPPRQRSKYKQKQSQIRALKDSISCGERTLKNYYYWGALCELMDIY